MGLYDQAKMADTPYMSQFVGSIVPELADYSKVMQTKYNEAADTDDQLTEALNNLQHLNFASDTQYANELKQQFYQKLQDRSTRGDYENMGRRTRRDAMNFSAAYQPLIQRQTDFANVTKRVNNDPNIADPAKKQQILQYIQDMNSTPIDPATGSFYRDPAGKVQLNGIQDWAYAKDVDKNKKISDLLSKKEAEIKQTGWTSNGQGERVNTIDKVRTPESMAALSDQIQQTDPEIKAMTDRDVTLQNYKLTPDQVKQGLQQSSVTPYQQMRQAGHSDHEIAVYAKANGKSINDFKQSPVKQQVANLVATGMDQASAERSVYNQLTAQQMHNPTNQQMGQLFSMNQQSSDEHKDWGMAAAAGTKAGKDANFEFIPNAMGQVGTEDPLKTVQNYSDNTSALKSSAANFQSSILAAMKLAGTSSGDSKKDMTSSMSIMHNEAQLKDLRDRVAASNPQLAQVLNTKFTEYKNTAASVENQGSHIDELERAGNVHWDELYKEYKNQDMVGSGIFGKPNLSKDDFIQAVRSSQGNSFDPRPANRALNVATDEYQNSLKKGGTELNKNVSAYTMMEPTGSGKVADLTDMADNLASSGDLRVTDVNNPAKGPQSVYDLMGINRSKDINDKATRLSEKGMKIRFNTETLNGKPTMSITGRDKDGNQVNKVVTAENLPPNVVDEVAMEGIKKAHMANSGDYSTRVMQQSLRSLGTVEASDTTPQYLKLLNPAPSGSMRSLNSDFSVRVKPAGDGSNKYELYRKTPSGTTVPMNLKFNSVDDLFIELGKMRYQRIKPQQTTTQPSYKESDEY